MSLWRQETKRKETNFFLKKNFKQANLLWKVRKVDMLKFY